MSAAAKVAAIAAVNVSRMAKDRMSLFFTLVLPVVIIGFIGSATGDLSSDGIPFGLVNKDSGQLSRELAQTLEKQSPLSVRRYDSDRELAEAVRRGGVSAGAVISSDHDARLRSGKPSPVRLVVDSTARVPAPARLAVQAAVAEQSRTVAAAQLASRTGGRSFEENLQRAREAARGSPGASVKPEVAGREDTSLTGGFNYQAPSNLVMFVFITSIAAAGQLIETRRLGLSRRMLSTPTSATTILLGEAAARFAIALLQAAFIFAVGSIVFGVRWGDPVGAATLIALFVLVGTGVGMLFGTVFRTAEQAGSIGPPLGIGIAMLGGCMWPLEIVPPAMRTFGHLFPHAWAMDAWIALIGRGASAGDIALELAVLAAFAAALLVAASWRLSRKLGS